MEQTQPNYYAVIPANVRYAKIKANAKLLYGEISALANKEGYAWASNKYFAELYGVSETAISLWVKELADNGFIENELTNGKNGTARKLFLKGGLTKVKEGGLTKVKTNNTSNNNTSNTLSKDKGLTPEYGSKEINDVFNYWATATGYPITSNIKANRYACSNLLRKHKPEELERIINGVALAQQDKYAPRIADFRQLQAKWNEFIVWGKGRANNNKVGVVQ